VFPVSVRAPIRKVKLSINSHEVPGYNEVDAVGLREANGDVEWTAVAEASSVFGVGNMAMASQPAMMPAPRGDKIFEDLQKELQDLRKQVEELQKLRQELKDLQRSLKDNPK